MERNRVLGSHKYLKSGALAVMLLFSLAANAVTMKWNLNDVSYLYPLPTPESLSKLSLLSPKDSGNGGVLLPYEVYNRLPFLVLSGPSNEDLYESWFRMVSVRLDPCPPSISGKCVAEIRLVWQPVVRDQNRGNWRTQDVAIHSFYPLTAQQFVNVKAELWKLKLANEDNGITTLRAPLGVHPAFKIPHRKVTFANELSAILQKYCGASNLNKLTFMSEVVEAMWWRFGGIEKRQGEQWVAFQIPRLKDSFEDVFNIAAEVGPETEFGEEVNTRITDFPPGYPAKDNLSILLDADYRSEDDRDFPNFASKMDAIARFKNPKLSHALSHDCATCHYADPAKIYAGNRFPQLKDWVSSDDYVNPNPSLYNLTNTTLNGPFSRRLRAFGYFNATPAVSQRVIHDSAESAERLNQEL